MSDTTTIFEQEPDEDTFGGRFSRALDASELSTKDLAWRLGVQLATVRAWERDRSVPGSHHISRTAGLLGVSLSWLLHGVGLGPSGSSEELDSAIEAQFEKLKLLHIETGQLIGQLRSDLDRRATVTG
ncbi:transcriptional regulator [Mesorhizobium sp. Root157]|uniref:helix-turn-helix domain-containing protein n=1 Tax=Mesorhizobium sp. Root157 TaxID=1736477 RepID=UPI0006FE31CD|nr:transcriptional regulator [Mesorhizobium sp. Root157]KQZ78323.1 transcriptional regulator [Mesorhizobium sp. Root157]